MKPAPLLLAATCLAITTTAQARPFKDLCDQFEPLRKISDLKYVKPELRVKPKDPVKPQDVVFTIEAKSGPIRVVPTAEGVIEFPMTDRLCEENPNFEINQPKGTVSLSVRIEPALPPVRSLDYRLLESLRKEWDTAISRQNLLYRMVAPSAKSYQIVFEPGSKATAEVRLAQGTRKLVPDEKGVVRVPFEEGWLTANPTIVLSELPKKIGLGF